MKDFAFGKENFILLTIAVVFIIIGFLLMSGGGSGNETFNPDIFSARRIVVAPIVTVTGFALVIYGIIKKTKDTDEPTPEKKKA
jgi:uncharacterized membrane protein